MVIEYHKSHSYYDKKNKRTITCMTQFYQIGLYLILDNNPSLQFSYNYADMAKKEKHLIKLQKEGKIKDLKFGVLNKVELINGLYQEVK